MKRVILIFFINIFFLGIFTTIYLKLSDSHFTKTNNEKKPNIYDYFLFSTGVQSGAGVTTIYPTSNIAKILVSSQLMTLIAVNIVSIFVFTNLIKLK
jgi:hypothetical protein